VNWGGQQIAFNDFLSRTSTNAFLVLRDGVITYEWYNKSTTVHTRLPSYSMAKTLTSLMIGQLIAQGNIKESDTFVKYFPKYRTGGNFDNVTIQNLLDMEAPRDRRGGASQLPRCTPQLISISLCNIIGR
jgi:CubicO group peptidase (beta-lactamase class C family)